MEIIEYLAIIEMKPDPLLGLFADEPEVMDQGIEPAMMARDLHPLRPVVDE